MKQYRKRPVVVEAVRITESNLIEVMNWCRGIGLPNIGIDVHTLEGTMRAHIGDWIIKGVAGEFYPCKHDIFERTYEMVQ